MPVRWPLLFCLYAQACLATAMLALGDPLPFPYALAMPALAVLAWQLTDRRGAQLPARLRDGLAVAFAAAFAWEAAASAGGPVLALGHLLALLQAAKFFAPKEPSETRQLLALGAVQVAIACVVNREASFAAVFAAYLPAAGLGLWLVERRRLGARGLGWGALCRAAAFAGASLVAALALFWTLPRPGAADTDLDAAAQGNFVTGFSPNIDLTQGGTLSESADVAFTVKASDARGKSVRLPADLLWRGPPVVEYASGKWTSIRAGRAQLRAAGDSATVNPGQILLTVEAPRERGALAFAPLAVSWARSSRGDEHLDVDALESCLHLRSLLPSSERPSGPVKYSCVVSLDPKILRPPVYDPPGAEYLQAALRIPARLERLVAFARQQVAESPADRAGQARKLLEALQQNGYGYALELPTAPPGVDPVEAFLFDAKVGNCELYASAYCLMLRAVGIPARIVQGYKGVDYNEAGDYHQVRALHAHAWVEAYMGSGEDRWLTLDPTPGLDRERVVEDQRSRWQWLQDLAGAAASWWHDLVVADRAGTGWRRLWTQVRTFGDAVWANLLGGGPAALASAAAACGLLGAGWGLRRWRRRQKTPGLHVAPRWPAYDAWLKFAAARGCPKEPWQTPQEHAAQTAAAWRGHPELAGHADLPEALVEAHYAQRFGGRPAEAGRWQQRLAAARHAAPA